MPIFPLNDELRFPNPAWSDDEGLLAWGGDLSPQRLLLAYRNGIFPWYNEDTPILWWSPDPRMVIWPGRLNVSRSLRKTLRQGVFEVCMDQDFRGVIGNCARARGPGRDGTWILPDMLEAYCALHRLGYAHSVECRREGRLVGGLYGVSLGAAFFGESMFSLETDASKVALAALSTQLAAWDFELIDCQMTTPHLQRMGGEEIPRARFLQLLAAATEKPTRQARWRLETEPPRG